MRHAPIAMGQILSCIPNMKDVTISIGKKEKRRRPSTDFACSEEDNESHDMRVTKKKKLMTTTQYIYKTLFQEERDSDVSIVALDKVWHLHKVYLSQSPYFDAMFSGAWKEAHENVIHIEILDERITVQTLDAVYGSMYSDEIELDASNVLAVLAAATLFHLEGIIARCAEAMLDNLSVETAFEYYEAAGQYAVLDVKQSVFEWFELNLLCAFRKHAHLLGQISMELITALTASPNLCVVQSEYTLYTLLRTWLFLQLHPSFDTEDLGPYAVLRAQRPFELAPMLTARGDVIDLTYFTNRQDECSFLTTPEGIPYVDLFQQLRAQYLTNDYMDLKGIFNDKIIPREWLYKHMNSHWDALLHIDRCSQLVAERARGQAEEFNDHEFLDKCMRFGRLLLNRGNHTWRWTGFNYGMDLILVINSHELYIRRHHWFELERVLGEHSKRTFLIRATVTSIDAAHRPIFTQCTEIMTLSLEKNEEALLLKLDPRLVYPLLISINMIIDMPFNHNFKHIMSQLEETPIDQRPIDHAPVRNAIINPILSALAIMRDFLGVATARQEL